MYMAFAYFTLVIILKSSYEQEETVVEIIRNNCWVLEQAQQKHIHEVLNEFSREFRWCSH